MKKVIIIFCFALAVSQLFSQSGYKEKIDLYVAKIDSNLSYDEDFHDAYMVHEIKFETNKRAIGKQYTSVKFYYPFPIDSVAEADENTQFLYIYKPPVFVSVTYNIAAAQNESVNYYFDEGSLVYYSFLSEGAYGNENEKYYFNKDELVSFETHTDDNNIIKEEGFTEHDLSRAANILKKASKYQKMFNELVKLEDIDK
jgi:hypothetical protein